MSILIKSFQNCDRIDQISLIPLVGTVSNAAFIAIKILQKTGLNLSHNLDATLKKHSFVKLIFGAIPVIGTIFTLIFRANSTLKSSATPPRESITPSAQNNDIGEDPIPNPPPILDDANIARIEPVSEHNSLLGSPDVSRISTHTDGSGFVIGDEEDGDGSSLDLSAIERRDSDDDILIETPPSSRRNSDASNASGDSFTTAKP